MPIEVFYSYAAQDEILRQELEKHLGILKRKKLISTWHCRMIYPGMDQMQEVHAHLNTAHIILLLVSSDFIASDYCYEIEVNRAMERHMLGEACIIPVLLRPVVWDGAPFSKLQPLPIGGNPVTTWANRDSAFYDITIGIQVAAKNMSKKFPTTYKTQLIKEIVKDYLYDFAFSYASEDRVYAEALSNSLRHQGVRVFCYSQDMDKKRRLALWGKNRNAHRFDIYQKQSRYCVVFLSRNYASKSWTDQEKTVFLDRALNEQEYYIFPIHLDDTDIPDISTDITYIRWHDYTVEEIAGILVEKLREISHIVHQNK